MNESTSRTIYCGNLSSEVCNEVLFDLFLQAGPLEKVSIPQDREGRSKGYGFVTFKHECSVSYAKELMKGTTLYGRTIKLQNSTSAVFGTMPNDSRNSHHQRSISLQAQGMPYYGLAPNFNQAQPSYNLSDLASLAGLIYGNPMVPQNMNRQHHHQRSRSYNMGGNYNDRNQRDERRGYYGSSNGRQQSRDYNYDHHGRPRDNDQYRVRDNDQYRARDNDQHRARDNDQHRARDYDQSDRSRGSNFRNRERDRSRSNNRPHSNRHRSRD